MDISVRQACMIWDDLRDAMDGKASHGHKAEIYAFRLMPHRPKVSIRRNFDDVDKIRAAKSLVKLIDIFIERYSDHYAFIDGTGYSLWVDKIQENFDHKVKVEIRNLRKG